MKTLTKEQIILLHSQLKYNQETLDAMAEAERISRDPSVKGYTDLDELFKDLDN